MYIIGNLDLLSVGIAIAGMAILGFAVYFNNRKSITNISFLFFSFAAIFWSLFNYLYTQPHEINLTLWLLRIHAFFAIWYVYFLFQFFYVFPRDKCSFPVWYKVLVVGAISASLVTLTPLVFSEIIELFPNGTLSKVSNGSGIFIFGLTVTAFFIGAIGILLKKAIRATGLVKRQFDFVLIGATITFSLHIVFNFILPAFFQDPSYIYLGAVFIFPLVAFTSYAILKHHLLNMKVVATEILTFALTVGILFEVILARDVAALILRTSIFILVLSISILLNRSVRKEVEQREQLEVLTKELEAANEQLKILDQARADFITIASHQLRTPPATIKWYLAAILDGDYGKFDDSVKEQLRKTMSTNNSMIALIDDLLNASRIERGKMEFMFGPTDLVEITQITVDQLLPQAEMKKLKLNFTKPTESLPTITADKEKLRQVINNFIDNAIKYTTQGSITVELSKTAKDLKVKVTDTGRGVTKDQVNHIFEKYDRGKSPARNSSGLGLGLYVAKFIIEQHKGKVWVESAGEGKGSSFIFTVPIKAKLENSVFDLTKAQGK